MDVEWIASKLEEMLKSDGVSLETIPKMSKIFDINLVGNIVHLISGQGDDYEIVVKRVRM